MLPGVVTMSRDGLLQRLRRLSNGQRRLVMRASMMLGLASAAVAILPFRLAIRLAPYRLARAADRQMTVCGQFKPFPVDCPGGRRASRRGWPFSACFAPPGKRPPALRSKASSGNRQARGSCLGDGRWPARHRRRGSKGLCAHRDLSLRPAESDYLFDYRVFGLAIRSDLPLPELFEAAPPSEPDVVIRVAPISEERSEPGLHVEGEALLLTIPDVARYRIEGGTEIVVDATLGARPEYPLVSPRLGIRRLAPPTRVAAASRQCGGGRWQGGRLYGRKRRRQVDASGMVSRPRPPHRRRRRLRGRV